MAYWAKVKSGKVVKVIAADESFFETFVDDTPGRWIETFKNRSQRKNYAGIGFSYDSTRDAFIPPRPYASWTLDEDTCLWEPPVAYPDDGNRYLWNEETQTWDAVE